MPFFAKKKSDGSVEPVAGSSEVFEDNDLASVTRRRDQAFKRLGELQFAATTRGSTDQDTLEKVIREIQFLDEQIKLIYDRRLQDRPGQAPPPAPAPSGEPCTCGAPMTSEDVFCRSCGNRRAAVPTAGGSQCPVCKQRTKPGSVFCAFCGARLTGATPGPAEAAPPARSFGFQMSAPLPQGGVRDSGLGDWHEGHAPTHAFAGTGAHVPPMPPAQQQAGNIRNQWGRHLEEIVNPAMADPSVYLRRGVALARENQLIEATEQFEQASKLAPRDPMPRYHLGLVRYRMGDLDGAIGEFERALRLNPNFPDAHNDLGLVLTKKGQVREAIHHFRKALQIQPQHPDAHYNLGYACLAMGDPVGASTHLDMYLRIAPNAPDARAVGEMLTRLRQQQS